VHFVDVEPYLAVALAEEVVGGLHVESSLVQLEHLQTLAVLLRHCFLLQVQTLRVQVSDRYRLQVFAHDFLLGLHAAAPVHIPLAHLRFKQFVLFEQTNQVGLLA